MKNEEKKQLSIDKINEAVKQLTEEGKKITVLGVHKISGVHRKKIGKYLKGVHTQIVHTPKSVTPSIPSSELVEEDPDLQFYFDLIKKNEKNKEEQKKMQSYYSPLRRVS